MPNQTINEAFASAFGRIRAQRTFASTPGTQSSKPAHDEACIKAAISKCVDLNVIVNRKRENYDDAFLLVAGLRGIVEDLIVLKYSLGFDAETRELFFDKLMNLNRLESILAQKKFFDANNPFQLVVGSTMNLAHAKGTVEIAKEELRSFWKTQGSAKRNGPSVKDMAGISNLTSTYSYIYFAASNFVHFNPHALMRTGWGP